MGDERGAVRTLSSGSVPQDSAQSALRVGCSASWWLGRMKGLRSTCELLAWLCDILHRSSAYSVCSVASQEADVRG